MILVKLGGSIITDKSKLRSFRASACRRLASELGAAEGRLAVVHGAGSFGHIMAKRHGLDKGLKRKGQLGAAASVQRDVRELNLRVIESLIDSGLNAVSVPPASAGRFRDGKIVKFSSEPFGNVLSIGLVPVTFGDVVPDASMGFSICSGDVMMSELAKAFRPELAIFVADVDGVFDIDPKRSRKASLLPVLDPSRLEEIERAEAVNADVTGSIFGKLDRMLAMARYCEKCIILNGNVPGRLEAALRGRKVPCTLVLSR